MTPLPTEAGPPAMPDEHLSAVLSASQQWQQDRLALDAAVAAARAAGRTWEEIGEVLGVTRQAALRRFRDAVGKAA